MNVIGPLIQFQQQLRIFHWQTASFAQHKAFGKAYEDLDDMIDTFVETYMGIFGRSRPNITFQIHLRSLNSNAVDEVCEQFCDYLRNMDEEIGGHTDLLNIRDSMLGEVHHLKYRLSLS